jgi:hypothetical protein
MSIKQGATKLTNQEPLDPQEQKEPDEIREEESEPVKGKIIFSKAWLIVCGVILFLIIALSIVVALLPD